MQSKEKICIIGGTGLAETKLFHDFKKTAVKNKYGKAVLFNKNNIYFIQRHYGNIPPHKINFKAYGKALADRGVNKIFAVNSVGSLKFSLKPGSIVIPDDFISLWNIPTFYDREIRHITPEISNELRNNLINICKKKRINCKSKGVYLQTSGPRLETRAEIKMFSGIADIVGMTLGSEITLANELGIKIAALCSVDNYANGIKGGINISKIKNTAKNNLVKIEKIISLIFK